MKSAIILLGLVFHFGFNSVFAADRTMAAERVIRELEADDLICRMSSLSIAATESSSIWVVQQSIEEAHQCNDFIFIDALNTRLASSEVSEEKWQRVSQSLLETSSPASPMWQNWYGRWIKWETQTTWKEAVLSALFFPQRYFLESDSYGEWNGNPAVEYSIALSAFYNNPQAQLYHAINRSSTEETDKTVAFKKRVIKGSIIPSATVMGLELATVYAPPRDRKAAISTLEILKDQSVTALYTLATVTSSKDLYLEVGAKGLKKAYLDASKKTRDPSEKLDLYSKVPGYGYLFKWQTTKVMADFEHCRDYYLELGRKGNADGYFKAADLVISLDDTENLSPTNVTNWLLSALEMGSPLAEESLILFTRGKYAKLLSATQRASLVEKIKESRRKASEKTVMMNKKILDLSII